MLRPTSVPADTEELEELRRTSTELREVVRYMKRERDLLEAKQSVTEGDVRYVTLRSAIPYATLCSDAIFSLTLFFPS